MQTPVTLNIGLFIAASIMLANGLVLLMQAQYVGAIVAFVVTLLLLLSTMPRYQTCCEAHGIDDCCQGRKCPERVGK